MVPILTAVLALTLSFGVTKQDVRKLLDAGVSDPTIIELGFRDATNLDQHPAHFHSTTWHLVDAQHMTQDWQVEGGKKGASTVHLQFMRKT